MARRKPIHLNFFKWNGCSRLLLGSSCIGIGASPAGPVWPDHFFGDLLRPCHEILQNYQDFTSMPEVMEKQCPQVDTTLSDYSVLSWRLKIPFSISKPVTKDSTQKVVKKIPEHYMESPQKPSSP